MSWLCKLIANNCKDSAYEVHTELDCECRMVTMRRRRPPHPAAPVAGVEADVPAALSSLRRSRSVLVSSQQCSGRGSAASRHRPGDCSKRAAGSSAVSVCSAGVRCAVGVQGCQAECDCSFWANKWLLRADDSSLWRMNIAIRRMTFDFCDQMGYISRPDGRLWRLWRGDLVTAIRRLWSVRKSGCPRT